MSKSEQIRKQILELTRAYYAETWPEHKDPSAFQAGVIAYAGRVFDDRELVNLVDASLDFWLTTGRYAREFEQNLARYMDRRYALLCNSGSSANLLAVSALTSPRLKNCLKPGDEVITVAAGFPTTVNPIIQNGLVPVFVDVDLDTLNIDCRYLEEALSPKTRAIVLAHTLGNPFDLEAVCAFAARNNLFLVEDNCDALGSLYKGKLTGSFGDISTLSFYPAHHITMGEGGCVTTSDANLKICIESFRDWGRDCWCDPGKDNTCGKRFGWQLGSLPEGYDHKYIYSHIGYNLKLTDMQAAVGLAQLDKLPDFIAARKLNWQRLSQGLAEYEKFLILPRATTGSEPSWFGFALTVREEAPFRRSDMVKYLEEKKIATRHIFGGNLVRQPAYQNIEMRTIGQLANSDRVMKDSFVLGVYPGISETAADHIVATCKEFLAKF